MEDMDGNVGSAIGVLSELAGTLDIGHIKVDAVRRAQCTLLTSTAH